MSFTVMDSYLHQSRGCDSPSDSEHDSSEEGVVGGVVKHQQMFIWNADYEKWHECELTLKPPYLYLTEHEDTKMEIREKQLLHIQQRWFHGSLTRREAKCILQDYNAGNGSFLVRTSESYHGKFAISFMHESRVKHVVIETKPDPVTGILYHITPNGPFCSSLCELVEEAKKTSIIQNHLFDVVLTKSPPKPDMRWLHQSVKTLSQAEQVMRKEHRDGSFFVYRTASEHVPYSLVYRCGRNIVHSHIMTAQRPSHGYILNGISTPVLYKLVHYFMENPIHGGTVLQFPVEDRDHATSNCAVALQDFTGDVTKNELTFTTGSLITNIARKSIDWCVGDHRGDRQSFFPTKSARFLSKDELTYITEVKSNSRDDMDDIEEPDGSHSQCLNLKEDYTIRFETESLTLLLIHPTNPLISEKFRDFKISCPSQRDVEQWFQVLKKNNCLMAGSHSLSQVSSKRMKKKGSCVIC